MPDPTKKAGRRRVTMRKEPLTESADRDVGTAAGSEPRDRITTVDITNVDITNVDITNIEIADMLRAMADVLLLEEANAFRVRAYRTAATTIEDHSEPVADIARKSPERLLELEGVGKALAFKIAEIVQTGRLSELDDPERKALVGAAELMRVPRIGANRARVLARHGIYSVAALAAAAREGRLRTLPGFTARSEVQILRGIDGLAQSPRAVLRAVVAEDADALLRDLEQTESVRRVSFAGEFRRAVETPAELELVASSTTPAAALERFINHRLVRRAVVRSESEALGSLRCGIPVRLRVVNDDLFGAALFHFTGAPAHVRAAQGIAVAHGLDLGERGVVRGRDRLAGPEEAGVYAAINLPWIPPELREDRGEIEAARDGRVPNLVTLADVRGDLQSHTTDSDGRTSLERMAAAAEALGYEYLAVTDHSPALPIVRGLDADGFRRQWARIDALNAGLTRLTVLKGGEVDVLEDGSLDLDDDTLAGFDIVLVSIHSRLSLPAAEQTRRIVRAISHRYVDVFAHPRARIIGRRPGAAWDEHEVFRTAAECGVMVEVNGQPDRLDLDDRLCRLALEHGLKITFGTDAHSASELGFMRWAVDQGRRGWVQPRDLANALPLAELRPVLRRNR